MSSPCPPAFNCCDQLLSTHNVWTGDQSFAGDVTMPVGVGFWPKDTIFEIDAVSYLQPAAADTWYVIPSATITITTSVNEILALELIASFEPRQSGPAGNWYATDLMKIGYRKTVNAVDTDVELRPMKIPVTEADYNAGAKMVGHFDVSRFAKVSIDPGVTTIKALARWDNSTGTPLNSVNRGWVYAWFKGQRYIAAS